MTEDPDPTPRALGAAAALQGKKLAANPYEVGTDERKEWRLGYRQAEQYRSRTSDSGPAATVVGRDGVRIARDSDDEGTPELRQHVEVGRSETREAGESRRPSRTIDLARGYRKSNDLTFTAEMAWRRFAKDFHIAQLDPKRAPDIRRVPGTGGGADSDKVEDARERIGKAMKALGGHGSPVGAAAWWVMGIGQNVYEFAAAQKFGRSRSWSYQVAKRTLIGAAETLEAHYESEDRRGSNRD